MKGTLEKRCTGFTSNMETLKQAFKMESSMIRAISASVLCDAESVVTVDSLTANRKLIKENTGFFSNFRGLIEVPVVSMLSAGVRPETTFQDALTIYEALKKHFHASEYLALVSMMLAGKINVADAEQYAKKGNDIYKKMRDEHPFLTSSEDSVFAVFMALSQKSCEELIEDMEKSYKILKETFSDGNSVQSLSHVLSFYDVAPEEKCAKVVALYEALHAAGLKYGKYYELALLGTLAMEAEDLETVIEDMKEVDGYLSIQKEYGAFGIDKKTRLMHAAMLVANDYSKNSGSENNANTSAITGTIAQIASQQAAMCCAIAAITAANAAASSH